ncbi:hypothetical protein [Mycobacterium sp. IS-3022]|uniref:hypothetical protein n=1 Tax=Mycobacterium sp. IS-3022 TaxID=1772277 RepID=UPI000AE65164|nr:hypothetical protein [Mycobacterium sp. IS-3022]
MIKDKEWRRISGDESAVVTAIIESSGFPGGRTLIEELGEAVVSHETRWILDIKTPHATSGVELPDGPFPARAFVPSEPAYQGEVIVWIENGHISGLEYAWVSDDPPTEWPRPDGMQIVPNPTPGD